MSFIFSILPSTTNMGGILSLLFFMAGMFFLFCFFILVEHYCYVIVVISWDFCVARLAKHAFSTKMLHCLAGGAE
jgi:hypothetical protein